MDVLNDTFFDTETKARPFPDEDYNKNGELRKVRGRVLKKLLKYELKAYLKPMLIVFAILVALAVALCLMGSYVTKEDIYGEGDGSRTVLWAVAALLFVYFVLFVAIFPMILGVRHYNKQFFTADGYLTLSIPASPEEHILAKRIASYVATLIAGAMGIVSLVIAYAPVGNIFGEILDALADLVWALNTLVSGWDILYAVVDLLFTPLCFLAICGAFCCWRHRGLKTWMIFLIIAVLYLLSAFVAVVLGTAALSLPVELVAFFGKAGKWIWLFARGGILYLLFRYETQTLRSKINLK